MGVQRAAEVFRFERWGSGSDYVAGTWRTHSEPVAAFLSVAVSRLKLIVTRYHDNAWLTVRGPETLVTTVPIPDDAEFFGIELSLGAFMPDVPPGRIVDRAFMLPPAGPTSFWLGGSRWEVPGPDDTDLFVERLVQAELLVRDPVASAALDGDLRGLSRRSVERRVARATGLSRGTIRQIRRAERAVELLSGGMAAGDVAQRSGYADQPHLTRSLRRFVGQTPAQIASVPGGR